MTALQLVVKLFHTLQSVELACASNGSEVRHLHLCATRGSSQRSVNNLVNKNQQVLLAETSGNYTIDGNTRKRKQTNGNRRKSPVF